MKIFDKFLSALVVAFLFAACAIIVFLFSLPAGAAETGAVTVPYGDWVASLLAYSRDAIIALVVAGLGYASRNLPGAVGSMIETFRVEQLLKRAVDYGIAAAAGAAKGQTISIPVANEVIRQAMQYASDNAPTLAARLGGTLQPKVIARLSGHPDIVLPASASSANLEGNE